MDPLHEPVGAHLMSGDSRALNGLGLLNIYVALSEARVNHLRCFALRSPRPGSYLPARYLLIASATRPELASRVSIDVL